MKEKGEISTKIKIGAFTICTKSYLSFARALTDSFLQFHAEGEMFVLFIDRIDGYFDPNKERFKAIEIEDLKNIHNLKSFIFKYDIVGLNTAVKPFFIEYLFKNFSINKLFYFDTDIMVFDRLEEVITLLDSNNIVLTPHIVNPIPEDGKIPTEKDFLMSGSYNLGFIALVNNCQTHRFIQWWEGKTYDGAVSNIREGLFRDQKPIDLVQSLFDKVVVLKHLGYNVAYWNLHERNKFEKKSGKYFVNGFPLIFFHYSGYSLNKPLIISKYLNRYEFKDFNYVFYDLFDLYTKCLIRNGYKTSITWSYAFGCFSNGQIITDELRNLYWNFKEGRNRFGNPFKAEGEVSFYTFIMKKSRREERVASFLWLLKKNWFILFLIRLIKIIFGQRAYLLLKDIFLDFKDRTFKSSFIRDEDNKNTSSYPVSSSWGRAVGSTTDIGVNLFAHFTMDNGVGEAGRSLAKILEGAGVAISLVNLEGYSTKNINNVWNRRDPLVYPINIFVTNADVIQNLMKKNINESVLKAKYNIGYWHWELSSFPQIWEDSFSDLSEIWVSSDFNLNSISKNSPVPVVKMPWRPNVEPSYRYKREDFGIGQGSFVYLFVYDSGHYAKRKNLMALIEAFEKLKIEDDNIRLILKTMQVSDHNRTFNKFLQERIKRNKKIILVQDKFDRGKLFDLVSLSDCYVSLHHSEGFGATIFEAMALGKPVIATAYSGNMDFMNAGNSFLIPYELIKIKDDIGPYGKGNVWAEPDISKAVELMEYVFDNQKEAKKIGERAKNEINALYSWGKLSKDILKRLRLIQVKKLYK